MFDGPSFPKTDQYIDTLKITESSLKSSNCKCQNLRFNRLLTNPKLVFSIFKDQMTKKKFASNKEIPSFSQILRKNIDIAKDLRLQFFIVMIKFAHDRRSNCSLMNYLFVVVLLLVLVVVLVEVHCSLKQGCTLIILFMQYICIRIAILKLQKMCMCTCVLVLQLSKPYQSKDNIRTTALPEEICLS